MVTLVIKSNTLTTSDVLIRDIGIIIPFGGGQETFTDITNIGKAQISKDLRTLTTDDAFGTDGSTLILNDGVNDVDQEDADQFLTTTVILNIGSINELGDVITEGTFSSDIGDILTWNGSNWVPGNLEVDDLIDVDAAGTSAPQVGEALIWNGVTWAPDSAATASNAGTGGVGPFVRKTINDIEFRNINSAPSSPITVALDAPNDEIDIDVSDMVGASTDDGVRGTVPTPVAGEDGYILLGNGVWTDPLSVFTASQTFAAAAQDIITTTSETYVATPDMLITPGAGSYIVFFSGSASMNKNAEQVFAAVFANGVIDANSVRELGGQANNIGNFAVMSNVSVADGQDIEIRWLISSATGGGAGTLIERSLFLFKTFAE